MRESILKVIYYAFGFIDVCLFFGAGLFAESIPVASAICIVLFALLTYTLSEFEIN